MRTRLLHFRTIAALLLPFVLSACHPAAQTPSDPLKQRGYLWQRDWTPAVVDALSEAKQHTDGVVLLGAEILWDGKTPHPIMATIPWDKLAAADIPCSLGLRIAPYPGPFAEDDEQVRAIAGIAQSLLDAAHAHRITLTEFQIDFDCAQGKLAGYHAWLRTLARTIHPTRLVITTLPSWLDEPEFPALVRDVDGYVLQVHSVPTMQETGHAALCDTTLARKWVAHASRLGIPFSVALPTYWCLAGYDPKGKLISVAMDSVPPAWPPGTHVLEFATNADDLAQLVHEWQTDRPVGLQEILWYRLPVATDLRNWRWPTLLAVMAGRKPNHHLQLVQEASGPIDFSMVNIGEADERLDCDVVVQWANSKIVAVDSLPGWTNSQDAGKVVFSTTHEDGLRLSPGAKISIGWIRFENAPVLRTEIVPHAPKAP